MTHTPFTLTLKSAEIIAPTIKHLAFEKVDGPLDYKAGQFISFHFEHAGQKLKRSYSVATAPKHGNLVEIAISHIAGGPASDLLFGLKTGDKLETTGPYGRFVLQEGNPKRLLLIATGTGVTPYLSMLPELKQRIDQHQTEVIVLLGVKNREYCLYGQQFVKFAEENPRFKFLACYSREFPTEPQSFERHGHVQSVFTEIKPDPTTDVVYLCGNPSMIDESFNQLKEIGFAVQQIRREKYISGV